MKKAKLIGEELKEQGETATSVIEGMTDVVGTTNMEGRIYQINKAVETWGYKRGELIGKPVVEVLAKRSLPKLMEERKHTAKGEAIRNLELIGIRKNGSEFPVLISVSLMRDAKGNPRGRIFALRDITERKKAEEALKESEEKFRDIVSTVPDWIWEVDAKGVYTFVSPSIKGMLGYAPEEVIGKTPFDFIHPDDKKPIAEYFFGVAKKKKPFYNLLNRNIHKNGSVVYLEASGVPILDEKGKLLGYRGIDRDITKRKKMEEALRKRNKELESFNRIAINRELKMVELKKRIKELEKMVRR